MRKTLAVVLLVAGCGGDKEAKHAAGPAGPAPAVVVAVIKSQDVPVYREFVARTEAKETVAVQARVEALLESMEFEEGRPVEKGQVLYRLDRRTYEANLSAAKASLAQADADLKLAEEQVSVRAAEAELEQAKARLVKAQQDVARLRPLAEEDAVPRQDLDTAIAAEQVAEADVKANEARLENARIREDVGRLTAKAAVEGAQAAVALAQLDVDYCTIACPIDGLIGRTEVSVGNLVGRGHATELATVSTVDPMLVTFAISEAEFLALQRGAAGRGERTTPFALILAADSVYPHEGRFFTAERAVAVETGTLQIVATFPNPDGTLRPGQFGRVRIAVTTLENVPLVPQRAVMEQQGAKIVLVVGDDNKVALRTVQVSERFEEYFAVTEGLKPGEKVIVEGQLKARPGSTVQPMDRPVSEEPGEKGG